MTLPTLTSTVPVRWASWLLLALALLAPPVGAQTTAPSSSPQDPARFGTVLRLSGTLTATRSDTGAVRTLQAGDALFVGERIEAAAGGQALLRTDDEGFIAVRPGASFSMEQFVAHRAGDDRIAVRLLQGGLRLVTGWVAKLRPQAYRITTPTATVGIRGTDHETYFLTEELAQSLGQPPGTYDKVNRGGTSLQTGAGSVDVEPGRVGFARTPRKTRALITLALPVILERIPDFYLGGPFDAELDALSPMGPEAQAAPETTAPANAAPPATAMPSPPGAPAALPARLASGRCNAQAVARDWVGRLDDALARRDSATLLALFAPDATVLAQVNDPQGGAQTLTLDRAAFAASSSAAVQRLSQFSQRRLSLTASPEAAGACERLTVHSEVNEQGVQDGKPYRFHTRERYQLELRDGQWLAVRAETRQR